MLSIIAAIDENNAIGKNNSLLWHIPKDLQRFKTLTTGHPVIMGRKTLESIGKALTDRTNIVLSRNLGFQFDGCLVFSSLEQAINCAKSISDNYFVIGGEKVYEESLEHAEKIYLTTVHHKYSYADTFFPKFPKNEWKEIEKENNIKDKNFEFPFSFSVLEKIIL